MVTAEHPEPPDVVADLAAATSELCLARERAAQAASSDFSWGLSGDVLRDLMGHAS
ncbi:hypothetical protein BH11ACT8_BH11ACT8_29430 [soil metagenome]